MTFNTSVFICSINIIWVCFMQRGRQRKREKKLILSLNIPMNKQVEKRWFYRQECWSGVPSPSPLISEGSPNLSCTRTTKTQIYHVGQSMKVARACHFHFLKSTAICNICVVLKWFQLFSLSFILVRFWEGHFCASTDQWSKTSGDQMWTFWFLAVSLCLFVELKRLPRPAGTRQALSLSSSKYFLLLGTWRDTCFPPS